MRAFPFRDKKAGFAPTVTTAIVLFNLFVFIIITAFAMDDVSVGRAGDVYSELNESGDIDTSSVAEIGFLKRFWIIMWDLPWWFNIFVIFVNLILIPICVLAWIRGL